MNNEASISVSLSEGKIEISGSESFVTKQLDRFHDLITGKLSTLPADVPVKEKGAAQEATQVTNTTSKENKYPNVIAIEDGNIKILKSIPGSNKSEKMVNTALLYLVGKGISGGDAASNTEIRDACKHHSCLDTGNFAKALKGAREWIIVSGVGKSQTAKLSHPGNTKAHQLASELNAQ